MDLMKPVRRARATMRFRLLALAGVVAVVVAGCGGSSTPTTTTKQQSATKKTASQTSTVAVSSGGTTSTSTSSSVNVPSFASAGNCTQLIGVGQQFAKAMQSATSGGKFNLSAVVSAYQNLANAAPSAIRPDLETLARAFTSYASALQKAGYTFGTVPSATQVVAIEKASQTFSQSGLVSASKAIEAWAAKNCTA